MDEAALQVKSCSAARSRRDEYLFLYLNSTCMIWRASHAVHLMCLSTLLCFPLSSFSAIFFFLPPRGRGVLVGGGNVRVSGSEAGLAVFICTHRVVLGSFVFRLFIVSPAVFSLFLCTPLGACLLPHHLRLSRQAVTLGSSSSSSSSSSLL